MNPSPEPPRRQLLQFGIGPALLLTAACAMILGTLRWSGLSTRAMILVLAILAVSVVSAVVVVGLIARSMQPGDSVGRDENGL